MPNHLCHVVCVVSIDSIQPNNCACAESENGRKKKDTTSGRADGQFRTHVSRICMSSTKWQNVVIVNVVDTNSLVSQPQRIRRRRKNEQPNDLAVVAFFWGGGDVRLFWPHRYLFWSHQLVLSLPLSISLAMVSFTTSSVRKACPN